MKKYIFIGIAGLIAWLILKPKSMTLTSQKTVPQKKPIAKAAAKPHVELIPANGASRPATRAPEPENIKAASIRRQAGFNKLGLNKMDGNWMLKVKFVSTIKKCEMGDLDLINVDQKRRRIHSLILALDDMQNQKNLFYQTLDSSALMNSSLTIKWKASDKPRALALQICSDAQNNRSCLSATQTDVNQPLTVRPPAALKDRVYYFQFIQENSEVSLLDASRTHAKDPRLLATALTAGGLQGRSASQLAQEVARKHTEIGSMAAQFENKELLINLPHNDPACPLPNLKF